jgi:hypothetical protein
MTGWQRAIAKLLLVAAIIVSMLSAGGLLIFTFVPLAVGMWWGRPPLGSGREGLLGGACVAFGGRMGVGNHLPGDGG